MSDLSNQAFEACPPRPRGPGGEPEPSAGELRKAYETLRAVEASGWWRTRAAAQLRVRIRCMEAWQAEQLRIERAFGLVEAEERHAIAMCELEEGLAGLAEIAPETASDLAAKASILSKLEGLLPGAGDVELALLSLARDVERLTGVPHTAEAPTSSAAPGPLDAAVIAAAGDLESLASCESVLLRRSAVADGRAAVAGAAAEPWSAARAAERRHRRASRRLARCASALAAVPAASATAIAAKARAAASIKSAGGEDRWFVALLMSIARDAAWLDAERAETSLEGGSVPFKAWDLEGFGWQPPTNEEWTGLSNPYLVAVRTGWKMLGQSKPELVETVRELAGQGEVWTTTVDMLADAGRFFAALHEVVSTARARFSNATLALAEELDLEAARSAA